MSTPFILVQLPDKEDFGDWTAWRATRVTPESTIDIFFYAMSLRSAKHTVRQRYPDATFSDEVRS